MQEIKSGSLVDTQGLQHVTIKTTSGNRDSGPDLPRLHFSCNPIYLFLYLLFLIILNVLVPCLLFYLLENDDNISTKELIGSSSAPLGLSSCFDSTIRLYRLVRHRRTYGPLGSDDWRYLDFVMWTYSAALLVFLIPLAVAPSIGNFHFFTMATVMLVGPVGVVAFVSLFSPTLSIRCSSDPKGTPMKPAVFYAVEDVAAVDFKEGRVYRQAINARWNMSPPFRQMMTAQTIFFSFAAAVYAGISAAVTFNTSIHFAFGWVLGQLFLWAAWVAFMSWVITRIGLQRESMWWDARKEGEGGILAAGEKTGLIGRGEIGTVGERDVKENRDPRGSGATEEAEEDDPNAIIEVKRVP